jgi:hypothetical protein
MDTVKQDLENFFDAYEARFNDALKGLPVDIEGTTAAFADNFIEASPKGIICGQNDDTFREAIPKGYDYYRSIGTRSMRIVWRNITPLDDYHALVKIHWQALYDRSDGDEEKIDFDVIYFVQTLGDTPKIFAYITGDEQRVLQEHGLIPENAA